MENNNQNPFNNFKKVTLTPDKKLAMRSELLDFMKSTPVTVKPVKTKSPFAEFMFSTQRAFAVLVIMAGLLGVIKMSEQTKYGDVLYPVKVYLADPINELFKSRANDVVNESVPADLKEQGFGTQPVDNTSDNTPLEAT